MSKSICKKTISLLLVVTCIIAFASGCSKKNPHVQFEMENGDKMVFELYPENSPETVSNFISLSEAGFYNGLTFHRIMKDFMVQGGDPKGDGTGGADKTIKGEFSKNGFTKNTLKHTRGVISMARGPEPDSASSQFFIMTVDYPDLDGSYAAFGRLISGDDVLGKIANTPVKANENTGEVSTPTETVKIKAVTVLNK